MVYCKTFYELRLPGEDAILMRNLTYISLSAIFISGPVYSMFSIYTVINKVRPQAISNLIVGVFSTITVFFLLKFTDLGVYAIVGISSVFSAIKNLTYNMFYLKKYAGISLKISYYIIFKNILILFACILVNMYIKSFATISSLWIMIIYVVLAVIISSIVYIVFGINNKKQLLKTIVTKLKSN